MEFQPAGWRNSKQPPVVGRLAQTPLQRQVELLEPAGPDGLNGAILTRLGGVFAVTLKFSATTDTFLARLIKNA